MQKILIVTLLLALAPIAHAQNSAPVVPEDHGTGVQGLLYARSFSVETPFTYWWTAEQPQITTGTLLVLEVESYYAYPRQVGMPVLYVGDKPAMLLNVGYTSGRLIVLVPGEIDLATTRIWFGSQELPERVDAARGAAELAAAERLGVGAIFNAQQIAVAAETGGEPITTSSLEYVLLEVADLIDRYSMDEAGQAELYRILPN
ncbi:MAG: hypothetical protein ACKVX7_05715 [Planctomycetota bacterium]